MVVYTPGPSLGWVEGYEANTRPANQQTPLVTCSYNSSLRRSTSFEHEILSG